MAKRELIDTGTDKRYYVRRDGEGRFKESDDVGRSLARDVRTKSKTVVKAGQGDRGDRGVFQSVRLPNGAEARTMSQSVYEEGRKRARKAFK